LLNYLKGYIDNFKYICFFTKYLVFYLIFYQVNNNLLMEYKYLVIIEWGQLISLKCNIQGTRDP